jgi:hypothetical protein
MQGFVIISTLISGSYLYGICREKVKATSKVNCSNGIVVYAGIVLNEGWWNLE